MITNLILSLGLSFAVGLNGIKENHNNYIEDNPTNVIFDDTDEYITFSPNELNNYTWFNLYNYYFVESEQASYIAQFTFTYNNVEFELDEVVEDYAIYYGLTETLQLTIEEAANGKIFSLNNGEENIPFEYDLDWSIEDREIYNGLKNAIQLDVAANTQQTSMGNSIISAITSGLGLISDLAREFLTGFSTLFWNANNSTLTSFGTFALVMLGVAITMAVISLVLNLIRGNTGA